MADSGPSPGFFRPDTRVTAAIFVVSVLVRVIASIVVGDQSVLLPDSTAFRDAAAHFRETWLMGDPFRAPLYPFMIVLTGSGKWQIAADICISASASVLVYWLSLQLFRDQVAAFLSGFAAALYPPLVFFSVVGLSETMHLTLMLAAFYAWYRARFTLAAVFAVLAIMARPIFEMAAPFFVLFFSLAIHRLPIGTALRHLAIYVCIYVVLLTPWWIHNYYSYGTFVRMNLSLGTVLYAGNNPMNTSGGGNIGEDYDTAAFDQIQDPVARDRALRAAAIDFMIHNPRRVVELWVPKVLRIWRPWPYHAAYSNPLYLVGMFASFAPVCLFALIGLIARLRRDWLLLSPLLLFIAYYTMIHVVLFGTLRFRLPMEPYLIIFAGVGGALTLRRWLPGLLPARFRTIAA